MIAEKVRQTVPVRIAATLAALATTILGMSPVAVGRPAPTDLCVVDDARATELSGLIATDAGYIAVNDSQANARSTHVVYLDRACHVTRTVPYPTAARDPEDLALGPDGSLWVGDIGDNITSETHRTTIALWLFPATGTPVIHRLSYPDGPHDAEALLFAGDGTPIIVTKELSGVAGIYQPVSPLQPRGTTGVALRRVGEFKPNASGENNQLGALGEVLVTGAATSPDRKRVVLRTYTAAYEWDVPDGDVVKAITTTLPRLTALPDEPQGEAIAYTTDGTDFLTLSDQEGPTTLRQHEPSTIPLVTAPPPGTPAPVPNRTGIAALPLWLTLPAAGLGLGLVAFGYLGLRRSRRGDEDPPAAEPVAAAAPTGTSTSPAAGAESTRDTP